MSIDDRQSLRKNRKRKNERKEILLKAGIAASKDTKYNFNLSVYASNRKKNDYLCAAYIY